MNKPKLYRVKHSNRGFSQSDTWGKSQFNASFPAGLTDFLASKNLDNLYIYLDKEPKVKHKKISAKKPYIIEPTPFYVTDIWFVFNNSWSKPTKPPKVT